MALISGTKFNDLLIGTKFADIIYDLDGSDTIVAGGGNDTIFAGNGGDFISGGDGVDTINYGLSTSAVDVNLAKHVGHGGYAEGDIIWEVENLTGSKFDDWLTGDSNANEINGGDGNDHIHGGGGVDNLLGGDGDDMLYADNSIASFWGGADTDTADFSTRIVNEHPDHYYGWPHHPGGVYVNLLDHVVSYDGPNHHAWSPEGTITGVENVNGTQYADTLIGDYGENVLQGNGGNDTLTGGYNNDTFVFRNIGMPNFGHDTITDFAPGEDHIELTHSMFANYATLQQHMQQVGNDVVITYDDDNSITLQNVQMANLHASDFHIL